MTGWCTATATRCVVSLPAASTATTGSPAGGAGRVSEKWPPVTGTERSPALTRTASETVPVIVTGERSEAAVAGACTCSVGGVVSTVKDRETVEPPACTVSLCFPAASPAAVTVTTPSPVATSTGRPSTDALALFTDFECTCTTRSAARLAPITASAGRWLTVSDALPPPHAESGASSAAVRAIERTRGRARNTTTFNSGSGRTTTAPRLGPRTLRRRSSFGSACHEDGRARHQPPAQRAPLRPRLLVTFGPNRFDYVFQHEAGSDDLPHAVTDGAVMFDVRRGT